MNTSSSFDDVIVPTPQQAAAWAPLGIRALAKRAAKVDWLWRGYLARGGVTLLTSQWKTGKTTLLSVLLSKTVGGGRLCDREVAQCRAGVVTEESSTHWRERAKRLDFGPQTAFFSRPFAGKPTLGEWRAFIEHLRNLRAESGLDLVVVDTLASFLPRETENRADGILSALRPLERLTDSGVAVLLIHHPRKGLTLAPGQAARGSGALSGYCDVILEMTTIRKAQADDRRRRLHAFSRYEETPRELVAELSADGRDYTAADDDIDLEWEAGLATVCELLRLRGRQMTRNMLWSSWPDERKPHDGTLWRWLDRGVNAGLLIRHGDGNRYEAYRYSLPGIDAPWDDIDEAMPLDVARKALEEVWDEDDLFREMEEVKRNAKRKKK